MSPKRVAYHEGAIADVKSEVAWYQRRSPKAALDFIEELHRAAETIREAPERWPIGKNNTRRGFLLWRFPIRHHIFRARFGSHNLGRRSRQQTTGVLGASPVTEQLNHTLPEIEYRRCDSQRRASPFTTL